MEREPGGIDALAGFTLLIDDIDLADEELIDAQCDNDEDDAKKELVEGGDEMDDDDIGAERFSLQALLDLMKSLDRAHDPHIECDKGGEEKRNHRNQYDEPEIPQAFLESPLDSRCHGKPNEKCL